MCVYRSPPAALHRERAVRMFFDEGWSEKEVHAKLAQIYVRDTRDHGEGLSLKTVRRWIRHFDRTGETYVRGQTYKKQRTVISRSGHWVVLRDIVTADPSIYLDEMQAELRRRCQVTYSISTIWRTLRRRGSVTVGRVVCSVSGVWSGGCTRGAPFPSIHYGVSNSSLSVSDWAPCHRYTMKTLQNLAVQVGHINQWYK